MKSSRTYLRHIIDSIRRIETFLHGKTYQVFSRNVLLINAVVRELEIIGEAANQLGKKFQKQHPEIPWSEVISMRNFLIHQYSMLTSKLSGQRLKKICRYSKKLFLLR